MSNKQGEARLREWERHKRFVQEASKKYSQQGHGNANNYRSPHNPRPKGLAEVATTGNFSFTGKGNRVTAPYGLYKTVFLKLKKCIAHIRGFFACKNQLVGDKVGMSEESKGAIESKEIDKLPAVNKLFQ